MVTSNIISFSLHNTFFLKCYSLVFLTVLSHLQRIFINISRHPLRLTLFVHLRIVMYTKSAFPTRLSFTTKPSSHLLVFTQSQQGAPHSPCQIQGMSIHLYSSGFPYFPCSQFLPILSFLPHLVHSSVPHVRFTSQQNTKDIFVYYHKHVFLPVSLHLLQNTIYILLPFSSLPFQKNVNPIFQIPPSTPSTNCPIHFILPIAFFKTMSWFSTFKILCQSSALSFVFYHYFHHHLCYNEQCKRVFGFV